MAQSVTTNGEQEQNFTNWVITNSYTAGDSVIYNGSIYTANSNIPANTAFASGTSGATWAVKVISSINAPIAQITTGGLGTVLYRTSDGRIFGAVSSGDNLAAPGACRYNNTNPTYTGLQNASQIFFYDSTLDFEETGMATYVGIQGQTAYVLFDSGNLWGWGKNTYGQLGLGNTTDQWMPRRLKTGIAAVYTNPSGNGRNADQYSRGICCDTAGKLWGCGYNTWGQLGLGNTTESITTWTEMTSFAPTGGASASAMPRSVWNLGNYVGCVIVETNEGVNGSSIGLSKYKFAGYNGYGQLGNNAPANSVSTAQDLTDRWVTGGSASITTTYRIMGSFGGFGFADPGGSEQSFNGLWIQDAASPTSSKLRVCGNNSWGNLGQGNTTQLQIPATVQLPAGTSTYDIKQVNSMGGGPATCYALLTNGDLYGWGFNRYWALGIGNNTQQNTPVKIFTGTVRELLFTGFQYRYYEYYAVAYLRKTDGSYWSTGLNAYGALATGATGDTTTWTRMRIPATRNWAVTGVAGWLAGDSQSIHPIMYDTDGILWSWGYYAYDAFSTAGGNDVNWLVPGIINPPNL